MIFLRNSINSHGGLMTGFQSETYGRYQTINLIGRGGMGKVYLARDPVLQRNLALKVIALDEHIEKETRQEYLDRFLIEARASAQLNHPSIVTVYDAGDENGIPWIAFEYVDGKSLDYFVKTKKKIELKRAISLIRQLSSALQLAHENEIIHRDIKPSNILIDERAGLAKLADFGIAKAPWSAITKKGISIGSPGYMSPEQLNGLPLDNRTDLFSLGVVFYEMLTGEQPFQRETFEQTAMAILKGDYRSLSEFFDNIPPAVDYAIAKCLAANRDLRVESATELINILTDIEREVDSISKVNDKELPTGPVTRISRPGRESTDNDDSRTRKIYESFFSIITIDNVKRTLRGILKLIDSVVGAFSKKPKLSIIFTIGIGLFFIGSYFTIKVFSLKHQFNEGSVKESIQAAEELDKLGVSIQATSLFNQGEKLLEEEKYEDVLMIAEFLKKTPNSHQYGLLLQARWEIHKLNVYNAIEQLKIVVSTAQGKQLIKQHLTSILNDLQMILERQKAPDSLISIIVNDCNAADSNLVIAWLEDNNYWLRWNAVAIRKAGNLQVDMVSIYILDLKYADSWKTRRRAVNKLGEFGDERAVPALREAQKKGLKDPFVAAAARSVLEKTFK